MRIKFSEVYNADLEVGTIYEGGTKGNVSDDVISKLMKCENSGGFRKVGKTNPFDLKYVILFSTLQEERWIDTIDDNKKVLIYHGDNKTPGKALLDTPKKGNLILKHSFDALVREERGKIPPFFIFVKEVGRNVIFRGIAVPKKKDTDNILNLIVVEDIVQGKVLKNYKAYFDILDTKWIDRRWLEDIKRGNGYISQYAPKEWRHWIDTGLLMREISYIESLPSEKQYINEGNELKNMSLEELNIGLEKQIKEARNDNRRDRLKRISSFPKIPNKVWVMTTTYQRSADVIVEVLERAEGVCERCGKEAPFIRVSDGTPYLEVHHKRRLADGGEDTVDNAIAVCPNCHRELHFGC